MAKGFEPGREERIQLAQAERHLLSKSPEVEFRSQLVSKDPEEIRHRIAERAYDLYSQRGAGDGHDMDDWLQAEQDILFGAESTSP